jgi:hypothetical protein
MWMSDTTRVRRFDRSEPLRPAQRLPNGWLRVDGRLARVGVQIYRDAAGNERRELRLPEEVFDTASMDSFSLLPLTDSHPPVMLDAKNAKQYAVGSIGSPRRDGDYMRADILITDEVAIRSAQDGKIQLSNGYSCELDLTQDPTLTAKYGRYDAIQRGIQGNHCALVVEGRAGPEARIRLDGTDAASGETFANADPNLAHSPVELRDKVKEPQNMPSLKMDGMTFEVTDPNAQTVFDKAIANAKKDGDDRVAAEKAKTDAETKAKADLQGAHDELKGKYDALTEKLKADGEKMVECDECAGSGKCVACGGKGEYPAKNMDAAFIAAKVERLAEKRASKKAELYTVAREHLGANEKLDGKSDLEIKALVVKKLSPKLNMDGRDKDAPFVNAAYELALASTPTAGEQARAKATVTVIDQARKDDKPSDPEAARQAMIERQRAAFKK